MKQDDIEQQIAEAIVGKFPVAEEFDAKACLIEEVAAALTAAAQAARNAALEEAARLVETTIETEAVLLHYDKPSVKSLKAQAIRSLSTKGDGT